MVNHVCPLTCTSLHIKELSIQQWQPVATQLVLRMQTTPARLLWRARAHLKPLEIRFSSLRSRQTSTITRSQMRGTSASCRHPEVSLQSGLLSHHHSFLPKDCARQIPYMLTHITSKKKYVESSTHQGGPSRR